MGAGDKVGKRAARIHTWEDFGELGGVSQHNSLTLCWPLRQVPGWVLLLGGSSALRDRGGA